MAEVIATLPLWFTAENGSRREGALHVHAPVWLDAKRQEAGCTLTMEGHWSAPRTIHGIHLYQALKLAIDFAQVSIETDPLLSERYGDET